MSSYLALFLREIRIQHWIKNFIVFIPLFFGAQILSGDKLLNGLMSFFVFSFLSSIVYFINDFHDAEEDKLHPDKKNRPYASGLFPLKHMISAGIIFSGLIVVILFLLHSWNLVFIALFYFVSNLFYTFIFKNIPLWDIILVSGMYILRLYGGSVAVDIKVSEWLFTIVFFGSLILILAKRYSEKRNNSVRKVLNYYSESFLHSLLLISIGVTLAAFSTYSINLGLRHVPSIVLFTLFILRYYYLVEVEKKGEKPESMLFSDIQLFLIFLFFFVYSGVILYLWKV